MRGKRAKAYKKLMASYSQSFGFREPYQVLLDDTIILDAIKFKMDLHKSLETTLRGKVKPLITQCCIRHLYALSSPPSTSSSTTTSTSPSSTPSKKPTNNKSSSSSNSKPTDDDEQPQITPSQALAAISLAKSFERRRCNHSISDAPLSSLSCLQSVILPSSLLSSSSTSSPTPEDKSQQKLSRLESLRQTSKSYNKHRYILATDSPLIRKEFRQYPGIPGIHIKRSVMVMDVISDASAQYKLREEEEKMRMGIKHRVSHKRQREEEESPGGVIEEGEGEGGEEGGKETRQGGGGVARENKRRRTKGGPKAPNPLSVMKKKTATKVQMPSIYSMSNNNNNNGKGGEGASKKVEGEGEATTTGQKKSRRKRRKGTTTTSNGGGEKEGGKENGVGSGAMEVVADGE